MHGPHQSHRTRLHPRRPAAHAVLRLLAALTCILAAPATALADWPTGTTVNVPVCTEVDNQEFPSLLPDGSGGAFVVWQDYRDQSRYQAYAQRFSAGGAPLWGADGIPICTATADQLVPHITTDGAGGAIVTWNDTRALLSDMYAQRLSASGTLMWDPTGVPLCTAPGPQHDETLIPDGAGGAIVVWWDRRDDPSSVLGDIYAQRVDHDGNCLWTADGVPVCVTGGSQQYPMLATDGAGGALITWADGRNGSSNRDIYAQRVNAGGVPQWAANGIALCNAANDQNTTSIASDGAGGAIVSWTDERSGTDRTYAQRVSSAGAAQWTANGLPLTTNVAGGEILPVMVSDGAGGAIVTWYDYSHYPTSGADIRAQRISSAGAAQWAASGIAVCDFTGDQLYPAITTDGAGGAIVTWQDNRVDFLNTDVYARHLTSAGSVLWGAATKGLAVSTAARTQYLPMITPDGSGGAVLAWQDNRGDDTDIYAQRVLSDGQLGGGTSSVPDEGRSSFALQPVRPNPVRAGRLTVSFSLPGTGSASLDLLDVAGRRIASRELAGLSAGSHTLDLGAGARMAPGLYLVRLRQGAEQRVTRVAVLD